MRIGQEIRTGKTGRRTFIIMKADFDKWLEKKYERRMQYGKVQNRGQGADCEQKAAAVLEL